MRRFFAVFCLFAFTVALAAQAPATPQARSKPAAAAATIPHLVKNSPMDLPVRKVVLYKNGVGYFEHAGSVTGNQRVAIDFTSPQLNDVLQSLTVLDEGGGRENLTALKGNDAAKRFVDELNRAEDQLQATRKQTAGLQQQKQAAVEKLNELISQVSFDWDVKAK